MEGERDKLLRMEQELHARVIGQTKRLKRYRTPFAAAAPVCLTRTGRSDRSCSLPTGVGKTELCKALANFLFDSDDAMVRIDMSEFMEKHSVSRLVGAPPATSVMKRVVT